MNAEHLHSLCVVAREGNVTAAARALGLSQPAVSRHLKLLQEECGTALYVRRGPGVALTPAGRALLPYACSVSQALTRAREALAGRIAPDHTRLRLGLSHHLTTRFTGQLLKARKAYDDEGYLLRLHLMEDYTPALTKGLREGSLDAAWILGGVDDDDGVEVRRVGEESLMLLVRSDDPLVRHEVQPVQVLEGETILVPSSASCVYRMVMDAIAASGTQPGRVLEVSGPAAVRSAVHDGLGIGVTVGSFMDAEARSGVLRSVALEGPGLTAPVTRLTRDARFLLPDQQHALAFLAARLGEPPPGGPRSSPPPIREPDDGAAQRTYPRRVLG